MDTQDKKVKTVSLPVDASLYELLDSQASRQGEGVSELITRLLAESMENWCAYCDSLRLLELEDEAGGIPRVCVVDKV